jgi:hypothetical protein
MTRYVVTKAVTVTGSGDANPDRVLHKARCSIAVTPEPRLGS